MQESIRQAADLIIACFQQGGKLLVCGNGGSAADSAHITGELVKGFCKKRPLSPEIKASIGEAWADLLQQGLPVIDLTANTALISAVANDQDAALAYAQQVTAYGRKGDILLGISTSGNAENVRRALICAKALGMTTIGRTGQRGGKMNDICDLMLRVPETETYKVQEMHLPLYHRICLTVEDAFFDQ